MEMQEELKIENFLEYNNETGYVYWKCDRRPTIKKGDRAGTLKEGLYRVIKIFGKIHYEHRLAWFLYYGSFPKGCIDHINGNKVDNRIANLRDVTQKENVRNTHALLSTNTSDFPWVLEDSTAKRSKKWEGRVAYMYTFVYNKRRYSKFRFDSKETAFLACCKRYEKEIGNLPYFVSQLRDNLRDKLGEKDVC